MEFRQYIGKPLVAWLWYNRSYEGRFGNTNIVCYVYPRAFVNDTMDKINAVEDFPEAGRLEVFIQGGQSAEEIFKMFGPLVSVKLNREISPNFKGHNRYRLNYTPPGAGYGTASDLTIERLTGKRFCQVLETETSYDAIQSSRGLDVQTGQPFMDRIVVKCGETLYGPFEYEYRENRLRLKGLASSRYQAGEYPWDEYVGRVVEIQDQEGKPATRLLPMDALAESKKTYDWISDEELVRSLTSTLKAGGQYTREQAKKIGDSAEKMLAGAEDGPVTEERKARVETLIQSISSWSELADIVLNDVLKDDGVKAELAEVAAERHFDLLVDQFANHEGLHARMEERRREETELQRKVDALRKREQEAAQEVARAVERETEAALRKRQTVLEEYGRKLQDARMQYDYERIQKEKLDDALKAMMRQYRDEAGQITRLFDAKLLEQIMRGEDDDKGTDSAPTPSELPRFSPVLLHAPLSREEIVDRVSGYLSDAAGRPTGHNDVVNYMICLTQGFLTIFTGKPGCGKTMLCGLLAKSLGIASGDEQNRYVEIPVERGWKSHQDFIGVDNPDTRHALARLNQECGPVSGNSVGFAPFLILLDEANLSPMEYYWSAFLRNSGVSSSAPRTVPAGNGTSWRLPEHLRFLATVNFDHTTERLTRRLLDRSWVITLEAPAVSEDAVDNPANLDSMVPWASLRAAFGPADPGGIDEVVLRKWNALKEIFQRRQLPIMPRNLRMVRDYCAAACGCMERGARETLLAPLDYAFAQKILPTISGNGEAYRELVYDLRRECAETEMPLTARHLERMQRIADASQGNYRFFER